MRIRLRMLYLIALIALSSDKSIDLFFADEEHLLINTSYKTRKNRQLIRDLFD